MTATPESVVAITNFTNSVRSYVKDMISYSKIGWTVYCQEFEVGGKGMNSTSGRGSITTTV